MQRSKIKWIDQQQGATGSTQWVLPTPLHRGAAEPQGFALFRKN